MYACPAGRGFRSRYTDSPWLITAATHKRPGRLWSRPLPSRIFHPVTVAAANFKSRAGHFFAGSACIWASSAA